MRHGLFNDPCCSAFLSAWRTRIHSCCLAEHAAISRGHLETHPRCFSCTAPGNLPHAGVFLHGEHAPELLHILHFKIYMYLCVYVPARTLRAGITGRCKLPGHGYGEWNLDLLEGQKALLTAEPSSPHIYCP